MNLQPEDIDRDPSSYVDPGGMVFRYQGEVFRAIRPEFANFYKSVLNNPAVQQMLGRQIVETSRSEHTLNGFGLVLRHRTVDPLSYCVEWPPEMLRDAALLMLDIAERLLPVGLTLQDAYPWNVYFVGPRPVFVDFTSIVPVETDLLWRAYGQFCNFFLYPLFLYSHGYGDAVRALLYDYVQGVSIDAVARLLPVRALWLTPGVIGHVYLPRAVHGLVRRLGLETRINEITGSVRIRPEARVAFFRSLRSLLDRIPLRASASEWRDYYADVNAFLEESRFHSKQRNVAAVLERLQPRSVVDIGSNQGGYSIMAARRGARVVAFDTDESTVSLLYRRAREENLEILPLVMNVINPTPAFGWRARQFPPASQRFRSELALALAVVHHLALTQRQSFERIAIGFADFTERWLLTEFVPRDDAMAQRILITNRRDLNWYTLDNFLEALRKQFRRLELLDSYPAGRTLILCTK